jgi:putative peptidoglycan lipid II flippase
VLSLLALVIAVLVLVGELCTPLLVQLLLPEWPEAKRELTERLVRILFPSVGLMVLSAWCLGILNSHRRFLLGYAAPAAWNMAIITAVLAAPPDHDAIVTWAAWGAVAGSLLQVGLQWPTVRRVAPGVRPEAWGDAPGMERVTRTFVPALVSRGAAQISAFIDLTIAGWLPARALAAITSAQVLYTLPVSLFGMAVSAAELPEMARATGDDATRCAALRVRLDAATQRLAFYIVPSAVAFLALGGVIAGAVYQSGAFTADDSRYVWLILAGSAIGLLAATLGRLYSSAFYALHDATTPLRCGLVRITLTAVLGAIGALLVPRWLGLDPEVGAAGLTVAGGLAGWAEFVLLRRALVRRVGGFALPLAELSKLWLAALASAVFAVAVQFLVGLVTTHPLVVALVVLPLFGVSYLAVTWRQDVPESAVIVARLRRHRR